MATWIVIIEVEAPDTVAIEDVQALLALLDEASPVGLHSAGRYAVQLRVAAASEPQALFEALTRWEAAVARLGLPESTVVRTEVMSPEELQREIASAGADAGPGASDGFQLLDRVFRDELTDLESWAVFRSRADLALARARDGQRSFALLLVDLDDFGDLNDRLGGVAGDQIMVTQAQRVVAAVRPSDMVGRFRGDEFVILLDDAPGTTAEAVAQRILHALSRPIRLRGEELAVSASIGVARARAGQDAESLIDAAEAALEAAKAAGPGTWQMHGEGMPASTGSERTVHPRLIHDRLAALVLVQRAAVAANESSTLEEAAAAVLEEVCNLTGWPLGHLLVPGASEGSLRSAGVWHMSQARSFDRFREATERMELDVGQGLPERIMATGNAAWVTDLELDETFSRTGAAVDCGLRSAFGFPVLVGQEVVAVLEFFADEPMEPDPGLLEVANGVGTQLGRVVERQRAAEALQRSEERFRSLAQSATDAIICADESGEVSFWSTGAEAMFGYGPEQIVGQPLVSLMPERYRQRHTAGLRRLMTTGQPTVVGGVLEFHGVRSDGREFPLELSLSTWATSEGRFFTAIIRDITERKRVEQTLRQRERQLAQGEHLTGVGSWEHDLESGQMSCSDEMLRLWGLEPGPGPSSFEEFLEHLDADARAKLQRERARMSATGEPSTLELRTTLPDGRRRWFRAAAQMVFDEAGRPIRICGTSRDITAEKDAEDALQASDRRYRTLVDSIYGGVWVIDAEATTTFVDPHMAEVLGYSVDDMVGRPARAFLDDHSWDDALWSLRHRQPHSRQQRQLGLRRHDGSVLAAACVLSPMFDRGGNYTGAVAIMNALSASAPVNDEGPEAEPDQRSAASGGRPPQKR